MFKGTLVQVRKRHISDLKGIAAIASVSVVYFGEHREGGKSAIVGLQGSDKVLDKFTAVATEHGMIRPVKDGDMIESVSKEAKTSKTI
jgi:hypothetical protein